MEFFETRHQFIDKYPISRNSKKILVGTIHPHFHEEFKIPFFYGNVLSLWNILSASFPQELESPITLDGVLSFLEKREISISDTIKTCVRRNPNALDKDLEPTELNLKLIDDIRNSQINEILFTSGFGKNNAFKLFYVDMLKLPITHKIIINKETILDEKIFGRSVKLTILYSPSGSSNVGISKSTLYLDNKEKYIGSKRPVMDFKIDYYREKFQTV